MKRPRGWYDMTYRQQKEWLERDNEYEDRLLELQRARHESEDLLQEEVKRNLRTIGKMKWERLEEMKRAFMDYQIALDFIFSKGLQAEFGVFAEEARSSDAGGE